jgi:hypothetical protein
MKTFTDAGQPIYRLMQSVMDEHHGSLTTAAVKVKVIIVRDFDRDDNPKTSLKFAGRSATALIHKVQRKRRVYVSHDVEIEIDGMIFDSLTEIKRKALFDHELSHVTIVTDQNGMTMTDDDGHAKLKLIPDDFVVTGFLAVVRHYGEDAIEYGSIKSCLDAAAVELEHFLNPVAEQDSVPS